MISNFDVLADESKVIYTESDLYGAFTLKSYNRTTGITEITVRRKNPTAVRLSTKDGLVVFTSEGGLYTYQFKTKELIELYNVTGQYACFSSFNGLGNMAAYVVSGKKPPYINIVNLNSLDVLSIKDSDSGKRFPCFSHSGTYVAYTHQLLNDSYKRRWIAIYSLETNRTLLIPKAQECDCILNSNGWSTKKDELVYLERHKDKQFVIVFNVETREQDTIFEGTDLKEVAYYDAHHVLLISEYALIKYNPITNEQTVLYSNKRDPLLFRPSGAELKIVHNNTYFLTSQHSIYCYNHLKKNCELIIESKKEVFPYSNRQDDRIVVENEVIQVFRYKPIHSNGVKLILAIGGPNASIGDDDPVLFSLLKEGYEVIVPAYRGCTENPYRDTEMGKQDVTDLIKIGNYYKSQYGSPLPVAGYSYGGFLMLLALSKTEGVFSCGVSLWAVTSLDKLPLYERYYHKERTSEFERNHLVKQRHTVYQSKYINTPVIFFHGENDTTSTTNEVQTIYTNMINNRIKAELIVYSDDTHGLKKHTTDYLSKMNSFIRDCINESK